MPTKAYASFANWKKDQSPKLKDPKHLLAGSGSDVRYVKVRTVRDIDAAAFGALTEQACGF